MKQNKKCHHHNHHHHHNQNVRKKQTKIDLIDHTYNIKDNVYDDNNDDNDMRGIHPILIFVLKQKKRCAT